MDRIDSDAEYESLELVGADFSDQCASTVTLARSHWTRVGLARTRLQRLDIHRTKLEGCDLANAL